MTVDVNNLPPIEVSTKIRSAVQLARRMLLLRWSRGPYLSAIGGNNGIARPPLGFGDDDFYRAVIQLVAADYKSIGNAFWQLIEIVLGPYQTLQAQTTKAAKAGQEYVEVREQDADRLPLYGPIVIDPLGSLEQETKVSTVDRFRLRIRFRDPLENDLPEGTVLEMKGGCWEFIETKARRVVVKILCEQAELSSLRGKSYIHHTPFATSLLRSQAQEGDVLLKLDDSVLDGVSVLPYPRTIYLNREQEGDRNFLAVEATSFNSLTREFSLSSGLPVGTRHSRNTKISWYQALSGQILEPASVLDTQVIARLRVEHPVGLYYVGGTFILIKSSTYQKRKLFSQVSPLTEQIILDRTLETPLVSGYTTLVFSDTTGILGSANVQSVQGQVVTLSSPAGFSTDILNKDVTVELVRGLDFGVSLEVHPLTSAYAGGESFQEWWGKSTQPDSSDFLSPAGWPPSVTPSGNWPGCYLFDVFHRILSNNRGEGLAMMEVDRSEPNDQRIYLARTKITSRFDPSTASLSPLGTQVVGGETFTPRVLKVADTSLFPSTAVVTAWRASLQNPRIGFPEQVVIASEGGFGRDEVYLWGKNDDKRELYISGLQRIHLEGVEVCTLNYELPVSSVVGTLGGSPSFDLQNGEIILDAFTQREEEIDYETLQIRTPTQALLTFERGFQPQYSHDAFKASDLDASVIGVSIVKADRYGATRQDGYSFPLTLGGGAFLQRLLFLLNLVRAAGVQVSFVDAQDAEINVGAFLPF